jgi:hypothetical protein
VVRNKQLEQSAATSTRPLKWHKWERIGLAGLLLFSLCARLVFLRRIPPGVRFDELVNVKMADHIYAGEWPIYFQEAWGHEPLYHYFHALGMTLLGETVIGVRITSILFGVLGVASAYLIFRQLFAAEVAIVSATLLATSLWSLMYSRIGLRHISLPPWIGIAAYCYWRGLWEPTDPPARHRVWFALGGLCLGAMLYTYFASRVVPVLFGAFTLYLLLFHRHMLRGRWLGLTTFFVLSVLIVMPMLLYLRQHPELEQRLGQVGAEIWSALRTGDPLPLFTRIGSTLLMFSVKGDPEWLYNISGRPVFDPLTATTFYAGVLTSLWQWRKPNRAFILLWLGVGIAPAMLSWPSGSLGHSIAAQAVVMAFPALFLVDLWRYAKTRRWARWSAGSLIIVVLLSFAAINGYDYFVRWPQYPDVRHEYQAPITAVARYLQEYDSGTGDVSQSVDARPAVAVSAPYVDYWNPWSKRNFDLHYDRQSAVGNSNAAVRWFDGRQSILFPNGTNREAATLFFLPDHIRLPSTLDADIVALLVSGSRVVETGYVDSTGATFDLYLWHDPQRLEQRLDAAGSAPVWSSPEGAYVAGQSEQTRRAHDLPLDIGHRLSLLGYAHDHDQLSQGQPARITTYWRVLSADSDPLAIFVHVLDDGNSVVAGWDGLFVSTETWQPQDVFIQIHKLQMPTDLAPGPHRVELGVYSPVNLQRLPIYAHTGDRAAHDRLLLLPISAP